MNDIVPELLEAIKKDFLEEVRTNAAFKRIISLIEAGTATYKDLNDYSVWSGQFLSYALKKHVTEGILPDGRMYYNIAERILGETLKDNYELVSTATEALQTALNKSAGIGIKSIKPKLNEDRIAGLVDKISNETDFKNVQWILGEPIINFSQAIVEDSIKVNAELHDKLGLKPKITRVAEAGACKWCRNLEGTYSYPDVPDDVYRRHDNCRCIVDYNPGDGKRTNVWTKK